MSRIVWNRRAWLRAAACGTVGSFAGVVTRAAEPPLPAAPAAPAAPTAAGVPGGPTNAKRKVQKPPALAPDLVREFVGAAHGDLDRTRRLLAEQPGLLNATWDWGGGDFETAIGGAGHMGRADIATFLIGQGARFDIFVAAMLGRLDIVKPALEAFPHLRHSGGPHGISLEQHARQGKEPALPVLEFLQSFG